MNRHAPQTVMSLFKRKPEPQGELFTMQRQLPVLKSSPEEERMPLWSQAMREKQTRH